MARTLKDCMKRDLLAVEEGLRLGRPQDVLIDPSEHRVAVVILTAREPHQAASVVAGDQIGSFAEDTLPIPSLSALRLAYQEPTLLNVLEQGLHFRGRDVITTAGHNVGRIVDVLVDDAGHVVEYRVAKGFIRRLFGRTHAVAPDQIQTAGAEVAVVDLAEEKAEPETDNTPTLV